MMTAQLYLFYEVCSMYIDDACNAVLWGAGMEKSLGMGGKV